MANVPAVCDFCGGVFPSGIVAEDALNISFLNVGAGPCPSCGSPSHIPDGIYNFIGNSIELLTRPGRSLAELEHLSTLLRIAQQADTPVDQVREQLTREAPELKSLSDALPKSRSDLYAFISILVAILSLVIANFKKDQAPHIEINQVINVLSGSLPPRDGGQPAPSRPRSSSSKQSTPKLKVGRNDPCPCGSGKKYKRCHGGVSSR